ncbi:MFS transporter [Microbacterium amylolyticum]|uniref:MFS family permease n=1 Tax=Microbacterium amylolyticum TaxID=936337 RepID=A0ABS4ZIA0_9MICO|nr:MFS transporter [Microbacterium amylolyticum]MBP2436999.1 MFS family permease [Microbacterium amylolyticum]
MSVYQWLIVACAVLLSATLVGMAIGAFTIGRLADTLGRRWTVVGSAVVSTVGMFLAASSQDVVQLGVWRVLTGLGVGGILASITVITSEYSSGRWRGLAIGGAALDAGWTNVMLYTGAAVLLLFGAVAVFFLRRIPEAPDEV